ncbi:MAG TPA: helix-turn-helix domain-containing protein [Actinophytocola sp.]|uniref:helix-turn-helix transcriptional regulator n=1 Tax=Actinophytocola sp. TaxID=1872138 RepID=UPI002DDCC7A9|nr:helix-turn-helix domain-containing protein [Actinophytocola sp.]HEV2784679.1 helix-turn-helix domain-containing protein [Actinophytocola sp.]
MSRLLTLAEVAHLTGIPEGTWRYWRHLGQGPTFQRIGRRLRIREEDLDAWLADQLGVAEKA